MQDSQKKPSLLRELDDSLLLEIFSKVGDAEDLTRCSLVCKRWRSLCWKVTRLDFKINSNTRNKLREQEHAMATFLQLVRTEAPGRLKELSISFSGDFGPSCRWLALAESLTSLTISLVNTGRCQAVWSYVLNSRKLETLHLSGPFWFPQSLRGWTSPCLKSCRLTSFFHVNVEMFLGLLAACPVLETLEIDQLEYDNHITELVVSSASLKSLKLVSFMYRFGHMKLLLHNVPNLVELDLGDFVAEGSRMEIGVSLLQPVDRLKYLKLGGLCTLDYKVNNLESLSLYNSWESGERVCVKILQQASNITELMVGDRHVLNSSFLLVLGNLKHLHVKCTALKRLKVEDCWKLEDGLKKHKGMTLHLRVGFYDNELEVHHYLFIKKLLLSFWIERLEVHDLCNLTSAKSELLRNLLQLQIVFGQRVVFK